MSGNATVHEKVEAVDGLNYKWNFRLHNDTFVTGEDNFWGIGHLVIPVADSTGVAAIGSSNGAESGVDGGLGGDPHNVYWMFGGEFSPGLMPGQQADFSFNTPSLPLVPALGSAWEPNISVSTNGQVKVPAAPTLRSAHITIDAIYDSSPIGDSNKMSVGGLVVKSAEGNNAPRVPVTIDKMTDLQTKLPAADGSLTLTYSDKVDLYDAATGGNKVPSGTVFAQANLKVKLYVQGKKESVAMRDVTITVTPVAANPRLAFPDSAAFTVVWVTASLKFVGVVDPANSAQPYFQADLDLSHANPSPLGWGQHALGKSAAIGYAFEAKGVVAPAGFDYKGAMPTLSRDVAVRAYNVNGVTGVTTAVPGGGKDYAGAVPGNDTSPDEVRDDTPNTIFDLDAARIGM